MALEKGVTYAFKIKARNTVGYSLFSEPITILVAKQPDAPLNVANVPGLTTAYQVGVYWTNGTYDGSSPVIDYRVNYALESDGIYSAFASNVTSIPYIATGLTPGVRYLFKIESRNILKYSTYSAPITVLAAQVADEPTGLADVPSITLAH